MADGGSHRRQLPDKRGAPVAEIGGRDGSGTLSREGANCGSEVARRAFRADHAEETDDVLSYPPKAAASAGVAIKACVSPRKNGNKRSLAAWRRLQPHV